MRHVIYRLFYGEYWVDGAGEDAKTPLAKEKLRKIIANANAKVGRETVH
jgi:hypothetical protein